MRLVKSVKQLRKIITQAKRSCRRIGFVPTMGYLHQGHLSLVRASRRECDVTLLSIYVNPLQFGPKEDWRRYPRDLKRDAAMARDAGVDILFVPSDREMYAADFSSSVEVGGLSGIMCGASRPGHFRGVATVVAKLFNLVLPDNAYFGQKDAQQVLVIRRMVQDLNFPVRVKVMPIIRENDGLAMSSRNVYLDARQRRSARLLYQSLRLAADIVGQGRTNTAEIEKKMRALISGTKSVRIDYINIVDARTLTPVKTVRGRTLIALAAFLGKIRLIDNILINAPKQAKSENAVRGK